MSLNKVIVYDVNGQGFDYLPPAGWDIEVIYREDRSLNISVYSQKHKHTTISEWSCDSWSHVDLVGVEP